MAVALQGAEGKGIEDSLRIDSLVARHGVGSVVVVKLLQSKPTKNLLS